jgi:hypothetical protein
MKKLPLNPDVLVVESFATDAGLHTLQPRFGDAVFGIDSVTVPDMGNTPECTIIGC